MEGLLLALALLAGLRAAGGNAKASAPSTEGCSLMMNSPDIEGVGGRRERDMMAGWVYQNNTLDV